MNSEEWTPTTYDVRADWDHDESFDRWLAEVKAEAASEALNAAAQEAHERGDIGKDGGVEAWTWLRVRAAQALDHTP